MTTTSRPFPRLTDVKGTATHYRIEGATPNPVYVLVRRLRDRDMKWTNRVAVEFVLNRERKETLKALGARWNPKQAAWVLTITTDILHPFLDFCRTYDAVIKAEAVNLLEYIYEETQG